MQFKISRGDCLKSGAWTVCRFNTGLGKRGCGSHMFKVSVMVKVTRDSLLAQIFLFSYVVLLL